MTGAILAYWLRRFSPRVELYIYEDEFDDVYTLRRLRDMLHGEIEKGMVFSRDFLRYVLLIKPVRDDVRPDSDIFIEIREPRIATCSVSRTRGIEGFLSTVKETLVLPSCLLALQAALYLREEGIEAYVAGNNLKGLWLRPYIPSDILTDSPVTREFEEICKGAQIVIKYPTRDTVYSIEVPFLDENIYSLTSGLARTILLDGETKEITPISTTFIERHGDVIASIGDCHKATSSVKTALTQSHWIRLCLDRSKNKILGAQGVLTPIELFQVMPSFLENENLCEIKNLQILALTKSPLFQNSRVLGLLLAAWLKTCS